VERPFFFNQVEDCTMLRRRTATAVVVIGVVLGLQSVARAQASIHLALGAPSGAKDDSKTADKNDFLMDKTFFALSYNNEKGTPNWVGWRLRLDDLGALKRKDDFHEDMKLPTEFTRIKPENYNGVGFDRGHMCPNDDRESAPDRADATFVMTNMVPQSPALNRVSWKSLEMHCRSLAKQDKELFIVAGPLGKGGQGLIEKKGEANKPVFASTLAGGKITVPAQCFKVVLAIKAGDGDPLTRVGPSSMLFAVIMANDQAPKIWTDHLVPVEEIEKLTGYTFFKKVPAATMNELRKNASHEAWRRQSERALARLTGEAWLRGQLQIPSFVR
jgi:endonuclease G